MTALSAEFIRDQIEEELNDASEFWKPDHQAAMACRDLEDLLAKGLRAFRIIRSVDDGWSRRVQSGKAVFDPEYARKIRVLYEWWIRPCDFVLSRMQELEQDYSVRGAAEFREARKFVRDTLRVSIEDLITSMNDESLDLDGILNEFREEN